MRDAMDRGDLSEAAHMFEQSAQPASIEAALLRGWVYMKKREYAQGIAFLNNRALEKLTSSQEAQRLLLLAIMHSRSNRFSEADEYFDRAAARDPALVADGELPYWRGRRYLEERRPDDAQLQLREVRGVNGDDARIHADLLESGILTQQQRYVDGALMLMHLLEFLDGLKREYREEEIWALHTLAGRARELDVPKIRRFVQARINRQEWTDDFRVNQFQTLKAVAWCHALEGDYFNTFKYLKSAGAIAPSPVWQAMVLLDRAYLAQCIGESTWSRSELSEAQEILESVSWGEMNDEERVALPLAAELCAAFDTGKAASYMAKFFGLRDSISPQLHLRYDERLTALAEYANGTVQAQLENRKSAIAAFRKAWAVYDGIGYDWRAGRCALKLYEMTREARWLDRAGEKLRNYSGSWLYDELRKEKRSDMPQLFPAQKRVFDMLVEGKTTWEMARETGRSPHTISNHVKKVLQAFDVSNRQMLLAEAIRRGLVERNN